MKATVSQVGVVVFLLQEKIDLYFGRPRAWTLAAARGSNSSSSSSSSDPDLGFIGPSPIGPPVSPVLKPIPSPTVPKVGPGGNVAIAVLLWAMLVDTADSEEHLFPEGLEKALNPDNVKGLSRDETAKMRIQFQQGTNNLASATATNTAETGVTVKQARGALALTLKIGMEQYKKILLSPAASRARARLMIKIENVRPLGVISGTRTTLQEPFIYKGKVYRFDAESILGHSLRQ